MRDAGTGHQPEVASDAWDWDSTAGGDHRVPWLPAGVAEVAHCQRAHARGIHGMDV